MQNTDKNNSSAYNYDVKTLIIAALIFLDVIPHGVPFVSDIQKNLGDKVKVKEEKNGFRTGQNDTPQNDPLNFSPLPYQNGKYQTLTVSAKAYMAIDMGTGEILLEKNQDQKLEIASLTKLMTARLPLKDGDLNKTVIVNAGDLSKMPADEARMWLAAGDKVTYKTLLHGLLINSAADAALTIADNLYPGGYNEFIAKMNEEVSAMDLKNTHYDNPVGWDSAKNYSTAEDLQILARTLLKNDDFKKIVATRAETVYSENGRPYNLTNTNELLDGSTVFGVKTGFTNGAGDCLIAGGKVKDHDVLTVALNTGDRFGETKNLLGWANLGYNW